MRTTQFLLVLGSLLVGQQATAGGGFPEPLPEENPPTSFRLLEENRRELSCKLCAGECPQEAGHKRYRYIYARRWHTYSCKKTTRGFIANRSYDGDAK